MDITTKLRTWIGAGSIGQLLDEAATEIERLRGDDAGSYNLAANYSGGQPAGPNLSEERKPPAVKLCKDCKHCETTDPFHEPRCGNTVEPVMGGPARTCATERTSGSNRCNYDGRYWEKRT